MWIKAFTGLLILLSAVLCQAASAVVWSEYIPFKGFVSLISEKGGAYLLTSSFDRCGDSQRVKLKKRPTVSALSRYVPSYFISAFNNEFTVMELLGGKTVFIDSDTFKKQIFMIYQSDTGRLVGVTDGFTAAVYSFGADGLVRLLKKEFSDPVKCIFLSENGDIFYTASAAGVISAWSSAGGRLLKHTNIGYSPRGMIEDPSGGTLLFYGGFGLFSMNNETGEIKQILQGPVTKAVLDRRVGVLTVKSSVGFEAYDYPTMKKRPLPTEDGEVFMAGERLIASIRGNGIRIYDYSSLSPLADLRFDSGKSVFSIPEDFSFSLDGIKTSSADGSVLRENICAKLISAERGIIAPKSDFTISYETPSEPVRTNNDEVVLKGSLGHRPEKPAIPAPLEASRPQGIYYSSISEPDKAESPNSVELPALPAEPTAPGFSDFAFSEGKGVPSWFATRKDLPFTEAVAAGAGSEDAFKKASKIIRDKAARKIMIEMTSEDFVKNISDTEVKKRFMWMTASAAANSLTHNIKKAHEWISPAGVIYVHASIDEKLVKAAFEKFYAEESRLLAGSEDEEYMKRTPYVIK